MERRRLTRVFFTAVFIVLALFLFAAYSRAPLISISAYAFKHPPVQVPDHVARQWVEEFIQGKRER